MKPSSDNRPGSKPNSTERAQPDQAHPSGEQPVKSAFDVFGSDLSDSAFEGIFERMNLIVLRSLAPRDV
jgi:hypothetical protein